MKSPFETKIPFASYDIAVYFGIGILILPFVANELGIVSAIKDTDTIFSQQDFSFSLNAFILIFGLFCAYALGHIVALASSYFIENFLHQWLGYPSDVWLDEVNEGLTEECSCRLKSNVFKKLKNCELSFSSIIHFPLLIWYLLIVYFKMLGFYKPKLPPALYSKLSLKLAEISPDIQADKNSRWLKVVEHDVANNKPMGYARLYNYLVIFGVLRSLTLVLLLATWSKFLPPFEWILCPTSCALAFDLTKFMHGVAYSLLALLTFMGFAKFNRRFFEEAVYAFTLNGSGESAQKVIVTFDESR